MKTNLISSYYCHNGVCGGACVERAGRWQSKTSQTLTIDSIYLRNLSMLLLSLQVGCQQLQERSKLVIYPTTCCEFSSDNLHANCSSILFYMFCIGICICRCIHYDLNVVNQ